MEKLLGDLKYHYHYETIGLGYKKSAKIRWMYKMIMKIPGIKTIDMEKIEKTPLKWFKAFKKKKGVTHSLYLHPLGIIPDRKDKNNKYKNEEL